MVLLSVVGVPQVAAAGGHPAESLQPGEWMELSLNTIADIDPCPTRDCSYSAVEGLSGAINDWCGGAFATEQGALGGLVVYGGGHNGYFGSEIYLFDVESQLWERFTEPYDDGSGSVAPACNDDGVYPDGSACPPHTYDRVQYHPGSNAFVLLFSTTDPVCGGCDSGNAHRFGFDDEAWALGATHPAPPIGTGASSAYDPNRELVWMLPAYNGPFSAYDVNADSWTVHDPYNISIDAVSAIDPGRDLFVTVDGRGTQTVIVHDLANPAASGTTVNVEGTSPVMESGAGGFEWDPVSEQFVGWSGGPEVWTLVPPDGDWATQSWAWLRVDPAETNTVTPSEPNSNGTYSRWRYVPSLNIFVVINRITDPVYAYRLSDDPGVGPNDDDTGSSGDPTTGNDTADSTSSDDPTTQGPSGDGPSTSGATASATASAGETGATAPSGAADSGGESDDASGCGCRSSTPPGLMALLALGLLGLRRRCGPAA